MYFVCYVRVGEGTVPLAIVVYIDGSFMKHKIPVKPIYVTVCNLNLAVSGKACAWRVLGMIPREKAQPLIRRIHGERTAGSGYIMHVSLMLQSLGRDGDQVR